MRIRTLNDALTHSRTCNSLMATGGNDLEIFIMDGWIIIPTTALALVLVSDAAVISNEHRMRDIHGLEIDSHMQDIHRFAPEGPWYM